MNTHKHAEDEKMQNIPKYPGWEMVNSAAKSTGNVFQSSETKLLKLN